ncbi:MAG: SPOR domain-containing protein [Saprospiraceae bacterium]|nr:SPOR domain-containing protein [Saprospiraceae bacterium]
MIYKKFKTNSDTASTQDAQTELAYVDSTGTQALPFTAEDSIILGLTGELPTQVGPEIDQAATDSNPISLAVSQENMSPVAKPVVNHEKVAKPAEKKLETKTETKVIAKAETNSNTVKKETKTTPKAETKSTTNTQKSTEKAKSSTTATATAAKGDFYVVSGSFLVPNNADKQIAKLKKMGFFNAKKIVFKNSSSYSAIAGQYESEAAAKASLKKLKAKGEEGFIKKI